jgi:dsRNA-specific ribonuclease
LREYPYEEHLKLLQDQTSDGLFRDSSDDYEGLMTTIGSILHEGSIEETRLLVLSLRNHRAERSSLECHMTKTSSHTLEHGEATVEDASVVGDCGRYMTALKEYSERMGHGLRIVIDPKGLDPPSFEASWDFQGLRLSAIGKSKKEARQKLARDFCQRLSIKVP